MPARWLVATILGAVTTVAVAWGCGWRAGLDPAAGAWGHVALEPSTGAPAPSKERVAQPGINVQLQSGRGVAFLGLARSEEVAKFDHHVDVAGFWPSWGPLRGREPHEVLPVPGAIDLLAQGWPFLSMWCEKVPMAYAVHGGVHLSTEPIAGSFLSTEHVLAFRPSWPGFLADALIYAGAWWVLLLVLRPLTSPSRAAGSSGSTPRG